VGLQSEPLGRPPITAPAPLVERYRHQAHPAARVYLRATVTDWNSELVATYLIRSLRRGDVLAVEAAQLVLTPVAEAYRGVDKLRNLSPLGWVGWWAGAVAAAPADAVTAFTVAAQRIGDILNETLFGGVEGRERAEIKADPTYNYGAVWSLRTFISSRKYASYFQKSDAFQYFRAINEQVLNAVRDALDARGIDSAAMGLQAGVIHNNTVNITSARDVALQGVAVGAGAQAVAAPRRAAIGRQKR
jgi:hypothetical protein